MQGKVVLTNADTGDSVFVYPGRLPAGFGFRYKRTALKASSAVRFDDFEKVASIGFKGVGLAVWGPGSASLVNARTGAEMHFDVSSMQGLGKRWGSKPTDRVFITSDGFLLYWIGRRWVDSQNPEFVDMSFVGSTAGPLNRWRGRVRGSLIVLR